MQLSANLLNGFILLFLLTIEYFLSCLFVVENIFFILPINYNKDTLSSSCVFFLYTQIQLSVTLNENMS